MTDFDSEKNGSAPSAAAVEQPEAVTAVPAEAAESEATKAPTVKAPMSAKTKRTIGSVIAAVAAAALLVLIFVDGARVQREKNAAAEAAAAAEAVNAQTSAELEAEAQTAAAALDFDAAYAKYAPDTVVLTVNGEEVTWGEYYCWIYSVYLQLSNYYGITDWNLELDADYTVEDYILEYASGMGSQYHMLEGKARELGYALTDEDAAEIDQLVEEYALANYGSMEALQQNLDLNYTSMENYRYRVGTSLLYNKLYEHFYGVNGDALSDADVLAFLTEHDYLHAKHILLKTADDSNAAPDEAAAAEKKALAEKLLAELQAVSAEELPAKFTEYVAEYSEDPGSGTYFDGYYFQSGEMVSEFEEAVRALNEGELSDIVETSYGYHIIYRPVVNAADLFQYDDVGAMITVRQATANALFSNMIADWADSEEIVYVPAFEALTLNELFDIAE